MCGDLKDYKICLINDRKDLEKQLGETATLTGEKVTYISSSADLKEKLKGPASTLNMVMIHKFQENSCLDLPDYLDDVLGDLRHVNKGTAIDRLLAETGIDPVRIAGIGDTMGDRFIAERVAWFGCPANAEAEIKKSASYVSPHPEVEGVLDILKRLSE